MVDSLEGGSEQLHQGSNDDGHFLLVGNLLPIAEQQSGAQQEIERHAGIAENHMDAVGVVALVGYGVMNGKKQISQLREHQKNPGGFVQPAGLAGFLLNQNGNVLVEQEKNQNHGSDEEPVEGIIQEPGHGVQMVYRVDCDTVKNQMEQHHHQQRGEGFVERTPLFLRGEIDVCYEGYHQKQRDFHPKHGQSPFCKYWSMYLGLWQRHDKLLFTVFKRTSSLL